VSTATTAGRRQRRQRRRRRLADPGGFAARWLVLLAVAVLWQLATMGGRSVFFPSLTQILAQARRLWLSGPASSAFLSPAVAHDVVPSLARLLGGWLIAVAAAWRSAPPSGWCATSRTTSARRPSSCGRSRRPR